MTEKLKHELSLGQFFTPAWASEILFDAHFGYLTSSDMVWEPTCGNGNMLSAIQAHIPCIGSEIDPVLANQARIRSSRNVINESCLTVELPQITAVFGNPPFNLSLFDKLLQRCATILEIGSKAGFIIPAYFLQTSQTVMQLGRKWGIYQEIIPRDLFPSLSKPLIFGSFIRDNRPHLIGFRLFPELVAVKQFSEIVQENLRSKISGTRSVWRESVKQIISELGGTASLSDIYNKMQKRRPTDTQFWKEKIRQICQLNFSRVNDGVYSIN